MYPKSTSAASDDRSNHSAACPRELPRTVLRKAIWAAIVVITPFPGRAEQTQTKIQSPNGRNSIVLETADKASHVRFITGRDGPPLIGPSPLGPVLATAGPLGK